ncbi:MAG: PAS domain S-box protein [Methylovulum sp.]|nr:PAS domain S-box protein [Methylovulum sp.]
MARQLLPAMLLPLLAWALQWLLWPWLEPLVWFLFYPAVFFSARLGGFWGGLGSTVLSTAIVGYVFIPPQLSWAVDSPNRYFSIGLFLVMGFLISDTHERLRRSQRKLAADLVSQSEARYAATFEQAAMGIALLTPDGRWLRANQKLCDMVGYSHAELLTKTFQDITHPDDLDIDLTYVGQILAGEIQTYAMEKRYLHKGGDIVWINLTVSLVRQSDGSPDYFIAMIEDIHRRKLAETALKERDDTLAQAQRIAHIGSWVHSLSGPIIWSDETYRLYGVSRDSFTPTVESLLGLLHPEDRPAMQAWIHDCADGLLPNDLEYRCLLPDGNIRYLLRKGGLKRDAEQKAVYIAGTVQDITERKQAEEAVLENKLKLEAALASMTDAVFISDTAGQFINFNDAFATFHKFANKTECARTLAEYPKILDVFMADGTPLPLEQWAVPRALRGETVNHAEYALRRKDTGATWVGSYNFAPIRNKDGAIVGSVVTARDITERKQAEQALRESEERLAGIIDSAMDAVISVDEQQQIQLFNPAAGQVFGLEPAEAIGRPVTQFMPERFRDAHADHIRHFAQTGITTRRMGVLGEVRGVRSNGEEFPIEASISQTTVANSKLFTVILRDITERIRSQQEIQLLNAGLEQRVAERTAELSTANRELDSFAYAVSHDLRAPLRAMSGFSQALQEDYGEQLQGEAQVYLEQIKLASAKMNELVDGLLTLSRSTRGELHLDDIDLSALSRRLLGELQQSDPGRQVSVQVETGLAAQGDARMVEVALYNLLGNAWKYTAHAATPRIHVYAEQRDGARYFCIADNGAGFDMAHASRLFQPFQRLHRQDEFPGIGIGLATVQRIVHRHGGSIEASGKPGAGAVFRFTLAPEPGLIGGQN